MSENRKVQITKYLDIANLSVLGIFFFFLPLLFFSFTTDAFILPKQILLATAVSISVLLFGARSILDTKIKFRSTPFDLPIVLLVIAVLASAIFSINRADSFMAFLPLLFAALLFFTVVNTVKKESQLLIILASLVGGTAVSALIAISSFFKIYLLPFPYAKVPYFNTFGSLLDQAIFFALVLPIAGYFVQSVIAVVFSKKKPGNVFSSGQKSSSSNIPPVSTGFTIAFAVILFGLIVSVYQLTTTQKPLILPLDTGIQTSLSAISQDTGRIVFSFLFGTGYGSFVNDFSRFKPVTYNLNQSLWSFTFFRSSTYLLELLATTGILGSLALLFLFYRIIKERNFFLPLILAIAAAFLLPLSFTIVMVFFALAAIFAVIHAHNNPHKFDETEVYFVTLKRGLLAIKTEGESVPQNSIQKKYSKFLPILFFIVLLVLVGLPMYFYTRYVLSDMIYQQSLVAYSQNNGSQTYKLQLDSINTFPYRDLYYRGLSQTNLALANSLAIQARSASPSAQDQQNILLLIQQSITAGRNAATIAPLTTFNWINLSSVYRGLIGFGQNAEKFALLASQQAIALDPKNPQQYIDLGGIYYQLGNYDEAIREFQIAIGLKNDYPNAYYNLGHALEMKGNLKEALAAYQIVKTLVVNDQENNKKITSEIDALQAKIDNLNQETASAEGASPSASLNGAAAEKEPLKLNQPANQLPERNPKAKIPGITISPITTPDVSPSIKPSASGEPKTSVSPTSAN